METPSIFLMVMLMYLNRSWFSRQLQLRFKEVGSSQAYTVYRGREDILEDGRKLFKYSSTPINPNNEIIITPGTQGALFLLLELHLAEIKL